MRLPYLPKRFKKTEMNTMAFLGVNLTENYQEGELADCKNLSSSHFPNLSQRKGRDLLEQYSDPTDVYAWGDRLVVVDGGTLYLDGNPITNVNDEPKQFAVVNTRLVVHPDMICVDLKNETKTDMKAEFVAEKGENLTIFGHNNVTFSLEKKVKKDVAANYINRNTDSSLGPNAPKWTPYTYTFGKSVSKILECWDADANEWDWNKLNELKQITSLCMFTDAAERQVSDGDIFIPEITYDNGIEHYGIVSENAYYVPVPLDINRFNTEGKYGILRYNPSKESFAMTGHVFQSYLLYNAYDASHRIPMMDEIFEKGDILDMTGTPFGLLDTTVEDTNESKMSVAKIKIKDLISNYETRVNSIVVENNTFRIPAYVRGFGEEQKATGTKGIAMAVGSGSGKYLEIDIKKPFGKDSAFVVYDSYADGSTTNVYEWDYKKRKIIGTYSAMFTSSRSTTKYAPYYASSTFQQYVDLQEVTFKRAVPDLDFICERDNRLWGVSNKDGTIYASGLGIPWLFYDYNGTDMDSYSVAVGSGGDFTGIVNYNGVLCFKEDRVHKLLGNYPSDYYMTTYEVAGIQKGSHRTAKTISEILYYKSPNGIMAFTGYQPTSISNNLLLQNTVGGIATSDGREYYLSTQDKESGKHILYKYDLQNKIWLKEEEAHVHSMTCLNNVVHLAFTEDIVIEESSGEQIVTKERSLYKINQDNDEQVEWFALFKPFMEDVTINNRRMKPTGYVRLVMRLQMEKGATLTIKKREDDGRWEHVWNQPATNKLVNTVPIKIGRCDKFELMLEGKGKTKIITLEREVLGNGKPNDVY